VGQSHRPARHTLACQSHGGTNGLQDSLKLILRQKRRRGR